jgi:hypothetical protein
LLLSRTLSCFLDLCSSALLMIISHCLQPDPSALLHSWLSSTPDCVRLATRENRNSKLLLCFRPASRTLFCLLQPLVSVRVSLCCTISETKRKPKPRHNSSRD